jgi:hypothetical protein
VGIDRTTKFAFVELHQKATRRIAADFLRHLAAAVPYGPLPNQFPDRPRWPAASRAHRSET